MLLHGTNKEHFQCFVADVQGVSCYIKRTEFPLSFGVITLLLVTNLLYYD